MFLTLALFLLGLGLLLAGAELLVRGASSLALTFGVSPLVVGLTVVAIGTSSPEFAVTIGAALDGEGSELALGNVVGSNIANVLLILGVSAVITPLVVAQRLIRLDVPLLIAVSLAVVGFALDGVIGRLDGALLTLGAVSYVGFAVVQSRRETAAVKAEYAEEFGGPKHSRWRDAGLVIAGLAMLVVGAGWLVDGAVAGARYLGVDDVVIGLTVVAVGTSLPEIATSIAASLKGERDIAVGNVVGSNLFNLLGVLGAAALVAPAGIPVPESALHFDLPVMVAASVACLPIFFHGRAVYRWEGALFLAYYVAYTAWLVLVSSGSAWMPPFEAGMVYFAVPLTMVTLAVLVYRQVKLGEP